ncbi:hypothetical protein [Roseovarius atlanticus]|uniref:hypothetical protein n=1 Tax=Roseovarius atlanticus TaxID=1641875 RepID=UPI001C93A4D8|nr:hypothetical protein [Roseovarius atlanticus]MBY5988179.1 hypothetical protein [Roseovarius atlanticus]MBY6123570.1 hypothetical protein [Roseovarius atlanticus]MBY6148065.1 hypothetical protein [Roseovarius atlanticus]
MTNDLEKDGWNCGVYDADGNRVRFSSGDTLKVLLPCPICGNAPVPDYGPEDSPFETPLVMCSTVHIEGDLTVGCPVHAESPEAWNMICRIATRQRNEPDNA